MNEEMAQIEGENRAFWSRLLRERFGRELTLEVDWDTFIAGSTAGGWLLYPLNIQRAGIERLLYALTGLMDQDERFKRAAIDRIESLYVANAADMEAVGLAFHKGRLTYHCFAGDWDGYYSIDEIKEDLKGRIRGKTRLRKLLERGVENLFGGEEEIVVGSPAVPEEISTPSDLPDHDKPEYTIEEYDEALRGELEAVYNDFIGAIRERNLDGLLSMVEISRTDEETLRKGMSSDGFVGLSEWMLTVYPELEQTTFISLRTEDEFAGYYMIWVPSYAHDYLNLTLMRFEKKDGRWQLLFTFGEAISAIVQVRENEDTLATVQDVLQTSPFMTLRRPESSDLTDEEFVVPDLPEDLVSQKEEFEAVLGIFYGALEQRDVEEFLSTVLASEEDEATLRRTFRRLSREILENTPEPSQAVFVKLQMRGEHQAGYYFVAPYPRNPSFYFVYLRPFVYHDEKWKMVFSLEHDLGVSLNLARSGGDLVSRAVEVIEKLDFLKLEWVMSSFFEDIIHRIPPVPEPPE